jgi:hypothetical protein
VVRAVQADGSPGGIFSACDYSELSRESGSIAHGYFTKAIIDTVNACNFEITHPEFLKTVAEKIGQSAGLSQTPQLGGWAVRLEGKFPAGWNYSI